MRITGGFLRGRALIPPKGALIRPTADKTRLAVFNSLESRGVLQGAVVIDAFCGTGALGIEAISRAAAQAIFIDSDPASLDLARENARKLGVFSACRFFPADATRLSARAQADPPATLVFLDPPYRRALILPTLSALISGGWLASSGAVIVVESEREFAGTWPDTVSVLAQKTYGQSAITLLEYPAESTIG